MAKLNSFLDKRHTDGVKNANEQLTVRARFGSFVDFLEWVVLPILILWTASTSGIFVYLNVQKMTNGWILPLLAMLLSIILIEGMKVSVGRKIAQSFTNGWYKDGAMYWLLLLPLFAFGAASYGGSIYLAVKGSPILSNYVTDQTSSPIKQDLANINSKYDDGIKAENKNKSKVYSNTWNGKVTENALSAGRQIEKTKQQINEARLLELRAATTENDRLQAEHDAFKVSWGSYISGFGGWAEFLQVLILFFSCLYEKSVYMEEFSVEAIEEEKNAAITTPSTSTPSTTSGFTHFPSVPFSSSEARTPAGFLRIDADGHVVVPITPLQTFAKVEVRNIEDVEREIKAVLRNNIVPYVAHLRNRNVTINTAIKKYNESVAEIERIRKKYNISSDCNKYINTSFENLKEAIQEHQGKVG